MVILQLEQQPLLIQAIFSGDLEEVRSALEFKQDVNYQDCEKRSPLHAAAFKGDSDVAALLLSYGARVNTKDSRWITPLHRACCCGSTDLVSILLRHQADTTARDRQWQTPLHVAAANNALECLMQLLSCVPNPNVTDRMGRTALHHAAVNGHNDVVELLLSKGCIVNACDKKDSRPIHCASHMGHVDTVELLLRSGADINSKDRNQYSPLHVAAASGMVSACRVLLRSGAQVDARNAYGNTSLHIACLNGHLPVCNALVSFGADIEATNYRGQTPLHIGAASTHGVDCLNCLVDQKVNINKQSLDGRSALHMTAIHGRFTRSKTLIDKGAIVDCTDKNGCTALHIAAQYGHDLLANTLLSYGAEPAKKGYGGRTPLHMSCLSGYVECCRKFLQAGVDLNAQDDSGKTPIHCAAYKGSVECLDLLVSNGANFHLLDNIGRIPLHYAAVQGHYPCVFTLVGLGSPINLCDLEGCSPLHLAAAYDIRGECVEYLLRHKADPKLKDQKGFTPIHYAVAGGNSAGLGFLLSVVGNNYIMYGADMPLTTPLHLAARNGNQDILRLLLSYFHDTNIRTEHGSTALLLAAKSGHTHCVQMLLRFGAKVAITDTIQHMTPVHYSARNGHMHCLALLLDNAEDKRVVDLQDSLQRTALMLAVAGGHTDSALTLLKCGAESNIVDAEKHSSLHRAVVNGQHNAVQLLITHGAEVDKSDVYGKTVLHLAASCGYLSSLQTILKNMQPSEITMLDNQECTALHWACYNGNPNCVSFLLEKDLFRELTGNVFSPIHCATFVGTERCIELLCNYYSPDIVKLKDSRNRTPLHIASLHGHVDCAKYLLEKGAEIDCKDSDGRTPLIAAAQNGQSQIIDLLLSYKADMTPYDNNGNTALHLACLKRHSHSALLLLDNIDDFEIVNMVNNDRKTPLHLSARNGLVNVTSQLIGKGSSVLAVDANGMTPALCCAPNSSVAQCLALILANYTICSPQNSANVESLFPQRVPAIIKKNPKRSKTFISKDVQTDITLLHDPDYFECRRMFNLHSTKLASRFKKRFVEPLTTKPKYQPLIPTSDAMMLAMLKQDLLKANAYSTNRQRPHSQATTNRPSCFIVENYRTEGQHNNPINDKLGYGLHRSHSDMSIAYEGSHCSRDSFKKMMIDTKLKKSVNVQEPKWRSRHGKFQENSERRNLSNGSELINKKKQAIVKNDKIIKEMAQQLVTLCNPRINLDEMVRELMEVTQEEETGSTKVQVDEPKMFSMVSAQKQYRPPKIDTTCTTTRAENIQLKQILEETMRKVQEQECILASSETQHQEQIRIDEIVGENFSAARGSQKITKSCARPDLLKPLKGSIMLQEKKGFLNIQTSNENILHKPVCPSSTFGDSGILNAAENKTNKDNGQDVQELYMNTKTLDMTKFSANVRTPPKLKVIETGFDDDIINMDEFMKKEQILEDTETEKLQGVRKKSTADRVTSGNSPNVNLQLEECSENILAESPEPVTAPENVEYVFQHIQMLHDMLAKGPQYFPKIEEMIKLVSAAITEEDLTQKQTNVLPNVFETSLQSVEDEVSESASTENIAVTVDHDINSCTNTQLEANTSNEDTTSKRENSEAAVSLEILKAQLIDDKNSTATDSSKHLKSGNNCDKIDSSSNTDINDKTDSSSNTEIQCLASNTPNVKSTDSLTAFHMKSADIASSYEVTSTGVQTKVDSKRSSLLHKLRNENLAVHDSNHSIYKENLEAGEETQFDGNGLDTCQDVISGTISLVPYLSVEKEMKINLAAPFEVSSDPDYSSSKEIKDEEGPNAKTTNALLKTLHSNKDKNEPAEEDVSKTKCIKNAAVTVDEIQKAELTSHLEEEAKIELDKSHSSSSLEEKDPKVGKKNSYTNIAKKKLLKSKDNQQCCIS